MCKRSEGQALGVCRTFGSSDQTALSFIVRRLETIDPPSQATRRRASTALERNEELLRYSQTSHSFLEQRGHDAKGSPARESCCSLPQPPMDSGSSVIMFPCSHSPSSFARDPMESGREVRRLPASPRRLRAVRRLMLSGRLVKKLPVADSSYKYWDRNPGVRIATMLRSCLFTGE